MRIAFGFVTVGACLLSLFSAGIAALPEGVSAVDSYRSWSLGKVRVHTAVPDGGAPRSVRMPAGRVVSKDAVDSILDGVLKAYRDDGYLLSQVERVGLDADSLARSVSLDLEVEPGPRCYLSTIALEGNRLLGEDAFVRLTDLTVGSAVREGELAANLEKVVAWYGNHGYPQAEVRVAKFSIDPGGGVDLALTFSEGRRVRVGGITIEGNHLTRSSVILRQFGIKPGDPLSMAAIEKGRERLITSDLYSAVEGVRLVKGDSPYKVDLDLAVREEKPNSFSGIAGLIPGNGKGIRPTGTLNLVLGNLWGTARKLNIQWMGRGEGSTQLDFRYREPWIGGSPLSGEFRFTQELRDTAFNRVEYAFSGQWPFGRCYSGRIGMEHQSIYAAVETAAAAGSNNRTSLLLGLSRSRASAQGLGRPWEMDLEMLLGRRKIDGSDIAETAGNGCLAVTLWRGKRRDLRLDAGGRFVDSPLRPVPAYHLFSIGGSQTVRGYAENRVWGNVAAWEQVEFSFGVQGESRYLLFYDFGLIDTSGDPSPATRLQGFGAGIRVDSKLGVMKVDYAVIPSLGPLDGRIHAGWSQGF